MSDIKITYHFDFGNNQSQTYELHFDEDTMRLIEEPSADDDWTELEYKKCSHCPLSASDTPRCPVAKNLKTVALAFAGDTSVREATISVSTQDRTYFKKTTLQEGLQSVFGLIMATSGCPHMDFLRPMARFHLPFASYVETMMRSFSFYLMEQYFLIRDGEISEFDLSGLDERYERIAKVNRGIVERIREKSKGDAGQNALVILNSFAQLLTMELQGNLNEIRHALE